MAAGFRRLFSIPCPQVTTLESAVRGFRPTSFPWLAVFPNYHELSFISHAGNGRIYKRPMPPGNFASYYGTNFSNNKDGWMMFVPRHGYVPIIFNPVTGTRLQHLPSLDTFLERECRRNRSKVSNFVIFLADNLVAFAECWVGEHVLAVATPGDEKWSFIHLSSWHSSMMTIRSIVFHEADRKFYYMDCEGQMQSFRLNRCNNKTVFCEVSPVLAKARSRESSLFDSHLMSIGTDLFQVRKKIISKEFDMLKYCPDTDMWIKINMDLGNNSLFFDQYGARLLPLPQKEEEEEEEEERRPRKNCIYFTDYDLIPPHEEEEEIYRYDHYVRVYDVGKGTVEPCFSTIFQSKGVRFPPIMWFKPSLSVKN